MKIISLKTKGSNSYGIVQDQDWILVDTGMNYLRLLNEIKVNKLELNHLKLIVITHFHSDHVGALRELKLNCPHAKVVAHMGEKLAFENGKVKVLGGTILISKVVDFLLNKVLKKEDVFQPIQPDLVIDEDLDLFDFGFEARIMSTPGHTAGSISVVVEEGAIVGDTLFHIFPHNIVSFFTNNKKVLMSTCENLLKLQSAHYYVGHGKPITYDLLNKQMLKLEKILSR